LKFSDDFVSIDECLKNKYSYSEVMGYNPNVNTGGVESVDRESQQSLF